MNGLVKVIDLLGNTVAQLEAQLAATRDEADMWQARYDTLRTRDADQGEPPEEQS